MSSTIGHPGYFLNPEEGENSADITFEGRAALTEVALAGTIRPSERGAVRRLGTWRAAPRPWRGGRSGACLLLMISGAAAEPADGLAAARDAFRRDIAVAYQEPPRMVVVQPVHRGLPDNPFEGLATGPFYAVRADFPTYDPGPQGFASADGRTVFAYGGTVQARGGRGLKPFLEAVDAERLPADAVARRLMWIFQPGAWHRLIVSHPQLAEVAPPRRHETQADGGAAFTWYFTRPGPTGLIFVYRADFRLRPDGASTLEETRLP